MKTTLRMLVCVLGSWVAASGASGADRPPSPFGVAATMTTRDGAPVVHFQFQVPPEHVIYANHLAFETQDGQALTPLGLPEPVLHKDLNSGEEKPGFDHPFTAELKLEGAFPANIVVKLQGCSNAACYFPEKHFFAVSSATTVSAVDPAASVVADADEPAATGGGAWLAHASAFKLIASQSGFVPKSRFIAFLQDARAGRAMMGGALDRFRDLGLVATLFLILIGGVGLNLTPCVLPLIPINLAIIGAGAKASSRQRGFALGATYGGGMTIVYGVLGLVVVLTGSKFGTLNSSVWFNLGIALIFVVMALAMFDLVNIDFSRFQSGGGAKGKSQKSQFVLAFGMGVVAALMAGACVAPVVISVLLMAAQLYGKGVVLGLLLPFLLGLGMALPWPFAGAGLSFLPKPGKWMKWIKYSFGVFILLFALYYGHLAANILLAGNRVVASARTGPAPASPAAGSNEALAAALQRAKAEGRPVFIDFAASWCKNCTAMDAAVFPASEVQQELKDFIVVKYDAEKPNESPAREVLDHFGVIGLPTYVVLKPNP